MKMFGEYIKDGEFSASIFDINVFGIKLNCSVDCEWELITGAWGEAVVEVTSYIFTVGNEYELAAGGKWHGAIINIMEETINECIYVWQEKQWEIGQNQGGY